MVDNTNTIKYAKSLSNLSSTVLHSEDLLQKKPEQMVEGQLHTQIHEPQDKRENTNTIKRSKSHLDLPSTTENLENLWKRQDPTNEQVQNLRSDLFQGQVDDSHRKPWDDISGQLSDLDNQIKSQTKHIKCLENKMKHIKFQNKALFGTIIVAASSFIAVQAIGLAAITSAALAATITAAPYIAIAAAIATTVGAIGFCAYKVYQHRAEIKEIIGNTAHKIKDDVVHAASRTKDGAVYATEKAKSVAHKIGNTAKNVKDGAENVASKAVDGLKQAKENSCAKLANAALKGAGLQNHIEEIQKKANGHFSDEDKGKIASVQKQFKDVFASAQYDSGLTRNILSTIEQKISSQEDKGLSEWASSVLAYGNKHIEDTLLRLDEQNKLIVKFRDNPQSLEKFVTQTTRLDPIETVELQVLNEIFAEHHALFTETIGRCQQEYYANDAAKMFEREAKNAARSAHRPNFKSLFDFNKRDRAKSAHNGKMSRTVSADSVNTLSSYYSCVDSDEYTPLLHSGQITHESLPSTPSADTESLNSFTSASSHLSLNKNDAAKIFEREAKDEMSRNTSTNSLNSLSSSFSGKDDEVTLTLSNHQTQHKSEPSTPLAGSGFSTPRKPIAAPRKFNYPYYPKTTHEPAPSTPSADSGVEISRSPSSNSVSSHNNHNQDNHANQSVLDHLSDNTLDYKPTFDEKSFVDGIVEYEATKNSDNKLRSLNPSVPNITSRPQGNKNTLHNILNKLKKPLSFIDTVKAEPATGKIINI